MDFHKITIQYLKRFEIADVSSVDYDAVSRAGDTETAFFIIADTDITLKVEFADGSSGSFLFLRGYNPIPVTKIFNDAGNTITSIQVGY